MPSEELEKLQACILKALQEAVYPLTARQLAASCGTYKLWLVREAVDWLRVNGHTILSAPYRGYWLVNKNSTSSSEERTEELRCTGLDLFYLDQLCYPLDAVVLNHLIEERGIAMTAVPGTAGEGAQVPRHYRWQDIWSLAQALGVPPEMLIDETTFLYDGTPSFIPQRLAGYKLLFGALREGLHPLKIIPPQQLERLGMGGVEMRAERHSLLVQWLCGVYKGCLSHFFSKVKAVLYICNRVNVHPAELFVGIKQACKLPLQVVYMDLATLPEWDALFLAAVARLLCKAGQADDATLITELTTLVHERGKWREKLIEREQQHCFSQSSVGVGQGSC